jgi:hypothetical protein
MLNEEERSRDFGIEGSSFLVPLFITSLKPTTSAKAAYLSTVLTTKISSIKS